MPDKMRRRGTTKNKINVFGEIIINNFAKIFVSCENIKVTAKIFLKTINKIVLLILKITNKNIVLLTD